MLNHHLHILLFISLKQVVWTPQDVPVGLKELKTFAFIILKKEIKCSIKGE